MGGKMNRRTKIRSSTGKQSKNTAVKQAAKKSHHQWSKDRTERIRDALNRDADLLYNVFEGPSIMPSSTPQTDSVVSLAETMQGLGR